MTWIEEERYRELLASVPMPAVDVLPCLPGPDGGAIGLIRRDDAEGGTGWNLVGGGIRRGETIAEAVARHVAGTLGEAFAWRPREFDRPDAIAEYLPERREGYAFDPRKHAIAATYVILAEGERAEPGGEAFEFRWFPLGGELPSPIGFGQADVIRRLLPAARALAAA